MVFLRFGHLKQFLRLCIWIDPSLNATHLKFAGSLGISIKLSMGHPDVKNRVAGDL